MTHTKCQHGKIRVYCVACYKLGIGGSQICSCFKRRSQCKVHGGRELCICGKKKSYCVTCGRKKYSRPTCSHGNKRKEYCIDCYKSGEGGSQLCPCLKIRRACKKCSPFEYCTRHVRNSIYRAFKRKGTVKHANTLQILGIESFLQFKSYFDDKIETWNLQNPVNKISIETMEIDHIKPVAAFDDSEKAKREVNHYTNLQPLPQDVNAHKSAKWSDKDEEFWRANIIGNAEFREIYLPCVMD